MQPIYWFLLVGITLVTFSLRKLLPLRLIDVEKSKAQRRWEWVGTPIVLLWGIAATSVGNGILKGSFTNHLYLALNVAAVAVLGIFWVWWKYRWLTEADELIRKIETEALALGFGLSMVGLVAADQLGRAGIGFDTSIWIPGMGYVLLVFLGNGIGRVIVYLRYQ